MKDLLGKNKGKVAIAACVFSVAAAHAQTFEIYSATTGALISQSSFSTLSGGQWDGQALPSANVLDVASSGGVNSVLLLNTDGTLSTYRMDTGALVANYTTTTFANGPFSGLTLADNRSQILGAFYNGTALKLEMTSGKTYAYDATTLMQGAIGGNLAVTGGPHDGQSFDSMASLSLGTGVLTVALADPDGSVSIYGAGGSLSSDPTATTFSGGDLDGKTISSVVGKPGTQNQPRVTYLGMDQDSGGNPYLMVEVVPEPSTIALFAIGGLFAAYPLFRRRK